MYQRSCDSFLGVPWNIAGSALFLSVMAAATGLKPRFFTHFLADAHIYVNHLDQVKEQLSREPWPLPTLELRLPKVDGRITPDRLLFDKITPAHIQLNGYTSHAALTGTMAV